MKLIIAGNIKQATEYAREHKMQHHEWFYTDNEDKLRGLRDIEVIRTGEYWKNPVNDSVQLKIREKRII